MGSEHLHVVLPLGKVQPKSVLTCFSMFLLTDLDRDYANLGYSDYGFKDSYTLLFTSYCMEVCMPVTDQGLENTVLSSSWKTLKCHWIHGLAYGFGISVDIRHLDLVRVKFRPQKV
jgi:hypothetical protein